MTRARRWAMGLAAVIAAASVPALASVVGSDTTPPGDADPLPVSTVAAPDPAVVETSRTTAPTVAAASSDPTAPSAAQLVPGRQEAARATSTTVVRSTTTSRPTRVTATDPSVGLIVSSDAAGTTIAGSLVVTNPNGFGVVGIEVRVTTDGSRACQLTVDTPTSLQIGPSVVVAVPARSAVTVAVSCDLDGATLPATLSATAGWDDSRLPGSSASTSITVELPA